MRWLDSIRQDCRHAVRILLQNPGFPAICSPFPRQIGIRMALGAQRSSLLWLVLRETVLMIGIGAVIGLPAAFGLTRLVQSFLYRLTPQDPASIALAIAGLIVVTGLAGYIPARRATRVDPMIALRYD